jgi:hypothetical protein
MVFDIHGFPGDDRRWGGVGILVWHRPDPKASFLAVNASNHAADTIGSWTS